MNSTTVEALKDVYKELGGNVASIANLHTDAEVIEALSVLVGSTIELPAVTSDDNGDVLTVVEGAWAKAELPTPTSELPTVTSDDNGDVLTVVEGAWAKATPSAGGENVKVIDLTSQGGLPSGVTGATLKNDYENGVVVVLKSQLHKKFLICAGLTDNGNLITFTSPIYITNSKPMYTRGTVGPWASGTTVTITEETLVLET